MNTRINIFYFLDSLCETSLSSRPLASSGGNFYVDYVTRDLKKVVDLVVPDGRAGLLNLLSTTQVSRFHERHRVVSKLIRLGVGELAGETRDRTNCCQ
jgi:CTD kinase subunit gamma